MGSVEVAFDSSLEKKKSVFMSLFVCCIQSLTLVLGKGAVEKLCIIII